MPTYNERENLPALTRALREALSGIDHELVLVDDNSPDGTGDLAEQLSRDNPITVVHRSGKLGLASAVMDGFRKSSGEIVAVLDADLQHPPEMIPVMLEHTRKADIVIASRYVTGGKVEGWTATREIISRIAKMLPHILFAKTRGIQDPLSGFFLIRKSVIEGVALNPIGYKILLEILVKGRYASVAEVPYQFRSREAGKSNFGARELVNYLRHLWRLARSERETLRFMKFCLVGASGFVLNLASYWALTRLLGIGDIASFLISTELSIVSNFTWNELWTFRDRIYSRSPASISARALKFHLVAWVCAIPSIASFWGFLRFTGIFDMIAAVISIAVATTLKFIFNAVWTWR